MQNIFRPLFEAICDLIRDQMKSVENNGGIPVKVSLLELTVSKQQVLFLVGGFGSNTFLANFLKNKLPLPLIVKQPGAG